MGRASASQGWLTGDRLPNVRLQAADGTGITLHGGLAGAPVWMVRASSGAMLPSVPPGLTAVLVADRIPESTPLGWRAFRVDAGWLDGLETDVLCELDANLRIQARWPLSPQLTVPEPAEEPPLSAEHTWRAAPVLQTPGVFEPELCEAVIGHLETDCGGGEVSRVLVMEGGGRSLQLDPTIKQRRECVPSDPVIEARMHERLMRRALPEIARVFNFDAQRRDAFKLLAYPENAGYFRAHRDNDTPDVAHRRFALSINLNHGAYAGGEFRFPEFGPHRYSPPIGAALVFSCSLLHEVLPVSRGIRYAATTFLA